MNKVECLYVKKNKMCCGLTAVCVFVFCRYVWEDFDSRIWNSELSTPFYIFDIIVVGTCVLLTHLILSSLLVFFILLQNQ